MQWKPFVIIIGQAQVFYLLPLAAKPAGPMGMVLLLLTVTFLLGQEMGRAVSGRLRFLFPVLTAVLFLPSVFLYYNESALIQAVWYLAASMAGVIFGAAVN